MPLLVSVAQPEAGTSTGDRRDIGSGHVMFEHSVKKHDT